MLLLLLLLLLKHPLTFMLLMLPSRALLPLLQAHHVISIATQINQVEGTF
jgi:hypothetical protein